MVFVVQLVSHQLNQSYLCYLNFLLIIIKTFFSNQTFISFYFTVFLNV
uniref:Uncharacterized protein n=1 Tax=Meloidogyne enterolobii TaxID=390850 RepID=A0A6V7X0P7_MELEN|nr:unnamed protein product [Meloidogyne enterolobii]